MVKIPGPRVKFRCQSHSVEDTYSSPRQHAVKVWTHGMHLCVFTLSGTLLCAFFIYMTSCVKQKRMA
jgi:hypothetical protein